MNSIVKVATLAAVVAGIALSTNEPSFAGNGFNGQGCRNPNREARFDRNHPWRSQVLDRSNNINRRINANRGNLDGHYGQLRAQDAAIRRQEQSYAQNNGGHLTSSERAQLNREENRLNRQITRDR